MSVSRKTGAGAPEAIADLTSPTEHMALNDESRKPGAEDHLEKVDEPDAGSVLPRGVSSKDSKRSVEERDNIPEKTRKNDQGKPTTRSSTNKNPKAIVPEDPTAMPAEKKEASKSSKKHVAISKPQMILDPQEDDEFGQSLEEMGEAPWKSLLHRRDRSTSTSTNDDPEYKAAIIASLLDVEEQTKQRAATVPQGTSTTIGTSGGSRAPAPKSQDHGAQHASRKRSASESGILAETSDADGEEEPRRLTPKRRKTVKNVSNVMMLEIDMATLSKIVNLPSGEIDLQKEQRPNQFSLSSFMGGISLYPFAGKSKPEPTLVLNPNGDSTLAFTLPTTDGKEAKVERVLCANESLKQAATDQYWLDLMQKGEVHMPTSDGFFETVFIARVAHDRELKTHYAETLGHANVMKIAAIVHKYDMSAKIRNEIVARTPAIYTDDDEEQASRLARKHATKGMFIEWVFGFEAGFIAGLRYLVHHARMAEGKLCDPEGVPLQGLFPEGVVNHILEKRETFLTKLLKLAYKWMERLRDPELKICAASDRHNARNCASTMAGSFDRGLRRIGLPAYEPEVNKVSLSVNSLANHLKGIEGHQPVIQEVSMGDMDGLVDDHCSLHPSCQSKGLWGMFVDEALAGIDEVPGELVQYLAVQRSKWEH